jgi:hypothetical protein
MKPIDVASELEKSPTNWTMRGLDEKIGVLQDKINLTKNPIAKREMELLVACIENRKKYNDEIESGKKTFKEYYTNFDTTTQPFIDTLLEKYKLIIKDSDIFVP